MQFSREQMLEMLQECSPRTGNVREGGGGLQPVDKPSQVCGGELKTVVGNPGQLSSEQGTRTEHSGGLDGRDLKKAAAPFSCCFDRKIAGQRQRISLCPLAASRRPSEEQQVWGGGGGRSHQSTAGFF